MKYLSFALKYLAIGGLLGAGIVLVDQLFHRYGNPQRVVVLEKILNELYESQTELFEATGVGNFRSVSLIVFGNQVQLEESCRVEVSQWPGLTCDDYPHATSISLSPRPDKLNEQLSSLERIAVNGTFENKEIGEFQVVRWSTDIGKLQQAFEESRSEPAPEPKGTPLPSMNMPQSYTAKVCTKLECITIRSASRTKVEGLVAQVLSE